MAILCQSLPLKSRRRRNADHVISVIGMPIRPTLGIIPSRPSQIHINTLAHSPNLFRNTPCLLEPLAQSFSTYSRDFNHQAHTWLFQPSITSLQDHKFSTSTSMCSHQLSYSLSQDYGFHCLMDILLFVRPVSLYHA